MTRRVPVSAVLVGAGFRGRSAYAARETLEGHLLGFAAERSRALGRVVAVPEYCEDVARAAAP